MQLQDFLDTARYQLQDEKKHRWSDEELTHYVDMGVRDFAIATKFYRLIDEIDLQAGTQLYNLSQEAIEVWSVKPFADAQIVGWPLDVVVTGRRWKLIDPMTLMFLDPVTVDAPVEVEYYAVPPTIEYGVTTELMLPKDILDAVEYYVLAKAYEKEDSPERLEKAQYYNGLYREAVIRHMERSHGLSDDVDLYRRDYYI